MNDINQMEFFRNAYRIAFMIAALALVLALVLFFVFDIRTVFLIKTGLAQRKAVQKLGETGMQTLPLYGKSPEAYSHFANKAAKAGGERRKGAAPRFRITQKTVLTHTDEKMSCRKPCCDRK